MQTEIEAHFRAQKDMALKNKHLANGMELMKKYVHGENGKIFIYLIHK